MRWVFHVMDWGAGEVSSASLFWNPGAITYLAESMLAFVLAVYLVARVFQEWRQGRLFIPTLLLAVLMSAMVLTFLATMLRVLSAGGWVSYVMPWSRPGDWTSLAMPWARPFGAIGAVALMLLAYQFPARLRNTRLEYRIVAVLSAVLIVIETVIAVRADLAMVAREIWWRPDWFAGWMHVAMIWTAVVFWRQLASAQAQGDSTRERHGWRTRLGRGIASMVRRSANREATAARAFFILTLLPIVHTATLFLPNEGQFGRFPLDIFLCWSGLAQISGLALIFLGYLPERSSFLFKLTVIYGAVLLFAIDGAAWVIPPVHQASFRAPGLPASGQSLQFAPQGTSGYSLRHVPFAPLPVAGSAIDPKGARLALPFQLTFYGRTYTSLYVSERGSIGLARIPKPTDAAFSGGLQPLIFPMLVDTPKTGTQLLVASSPDRFVLTRKDRCTGEKAEPCYQVQTVVHADGRIDVHYLAVPSAPTFWLFEPMHAPWLIGVMPGQAPSATAQPQVRDYYRAYLMSLDRLNTPIMQFALGAMLVVLVGSAVLFRGFLIKPLDGLLMGIRRFRNGDLGTQVPISYNDEIGYLTESFNELARAQFAMTRNLEQTVADRVAEIADLTARNAQFEERSRLSADLHDAVAQTMASASLLASALPAQLTNASAGDRETAERVAKMNRLALSEMRMLMDGLRSGDPGEWSLAKRFDELIRTFVSLHGLKIDSELAVEAALPVEVRMVFYRVAQECLNNIVKHSGAGEVELAFQALEDRAMLMVRDNGHGFDPEKVDRKNSFGLAIMQDRARLIGATLEFESRSGHGSRITMTWIQPHAGDADQDIGGR